mmetsp:Transcript_7392/g.8409  ORF Transcript_7392/g.8409 Transcript_7392/m.8409 type:complete len:260 (+) Transcript_7392:2-781(+)
MDALSEKTISGVKSLKSAFEDQKADHEREINRLKGRCDALLEEGIIPYKPTGETPIKRDYPYQSEIPATSPEHRIVFRYRNRDQPASPISLKLPSDQSSRGRADSDPPPDTPIRDEEKEKKDIFVSPEDRTSDVENDSSIANENDVESESDKSGKKSLELKRSDSVNSDGSGRARRNDSGSSDRLRYRVPREKSEPPLSRRNDSTASTESLKKLSPEMISEMKVKDLRKELAARQCPQFGTKSILQQRLREFIRKEDRN